MNTKEPDYRRKIIDLGWSAETASNWDGSNPEYRATQGRFSTPWLSSWKDVWEWVTGKEKECI